LMGRETARGRDHGGLWQGGHAGVMRRKDKQVTNSSVIDGLFLAGRVCRIGMVDNGEPYVVPVNDGDADNTLYIHSAAVGRKIDIPKRDSRVCFEIESPVEIVTDLQSKRHGLDVIMRHHGKRDENMYDRKQLEAVVVLKVTIESVACKQLGEWE